ncbi:hypothetical protein ACVW2L_001432 [Mucilaginibacter sp. HD30]
MTQSISTCFATFRYDLLNHKATLFYQSGFMGFKINVAYKTASSLSYPLSDSLLSLCEPEFPLTASWSL